MVRSLIIRQVFRLLDMALAVAVVFVAFFVVKIFMTPLPAVEPNAASGEDSFLDNTTIVSSVSERAIYDGLARSGLFGTAGRWDAEAPPEPEPEPEVSPDIEDSALNLKLRGTIALEPGNPFSSAFIENLENREGVRSFLLGQEVVENVSVDTIYKREVILLNSRKQPPQRERLRMEEQPESSPRATPGAIAGVRTTPTIRSASQPGTAQRSGGTVQHTRLNRDTIIREAIENYSTLATITPEVKRDESGNVLGLTAEGIGQNPMAQKLGFRDGDILQTVNNERIDSRERLMEIFERYQNANSFRIGILRNGIPNILVFDID